MVSAVATADTMAVNAVSLQAATTETELQAEIEEREEEDPFGVLEDEVKKSEGEAKKSEGDK